MKAIDAIKVLIDGRFDREVSGVCTFESTELGQLIEWFGQGYDWYGRFSPGTYLYTNVSFGDEPPFGDWDLHGISWEKCPDSYFLYEITGLLPDL